MEWKEAIEYIRNSSLASSVYIGSDSKIYVRGDKRYAKYCTVVIIHIDSCKGAKIFHDTIVYQDFGNLRQRLMTEVGMAIGAAERIRPHLGGRAMEVHFDINPDKQHKSYVAVKEALGWAMGMGLYVKIKPFSFASTHCADYMVRYGD